MGEGGASGGPGDGKANFDHIYDEPDPREYFRTLARYDYEIPQQAEPVFRQLLAAREQAPDADDVHPPWVLDLCCSYGINAALLCCEVTLAELFARYTGAELADVSTDELAEADTAFYAERRRAAAPRVGGLDLAGNAVAYARRVGLLDDGWSENLEEQLPSPELNDHLGQVSLVTATGGVGYITARTFDSVVQPRPDGQLPWVAAFVLRTYSYAGVAELLSQRGLVTEVLAGCPFPQRRFASDAEREAALGAVVRNGHDPAGQEDGGRYYADLYLSRPPEDAARRSVEELLADVVASRGGDT
ncbi:hypothetical protein [Rhodococcus sp. X156]|uniref:hypothetical protein n=1 Tax=Rhodococcus sp. X156 TaxID=2499145 RepID=UPI000FD6D62E|nr:hypothetical protein [Rhodococcus sp. X156]